MPDRTRGSLGLARRDGAEGNVPGTRGSARIKSLADIAGAASWHDGDGSAIAGEIPFSAVLESRREYLLGEDTPS